MTLRRVIAAPIVAASISLAPGGYATLGSCEPTQSELPPDPAGWGTPNFVDTFDGTAVDTTQWDVYDSPNAASMPRQADRAQESNGELQLVGGINSSGKYVSGGISAKQNQRYGRWEARIRVDTGAGYNAVMLLWPLSDNWPTDGEIDASEVDTGSPQNGGGEFLHFGAGNSTLGHSYRADMTAWHTIAVDWTPSKIVYYVDDVAQYTIANDAANGVDPVPSTNMHVALQNDVFAPPARSTNVVMHVDWVRSYAYNGR